MAESKGGKRRNALIIALSLISAVIMAVFAFTGNVTPEPHEINTADPTADSREEPPTATSPPTGIPTNQPTPTATETATNTTPHGTLKFTPELFIYHTP